MASILFFFLWIFITSSACCTHIEHSQPPQMITIQCQPTYFASKNSYHGTLSLFINITIYLSGSKLSTLRLIIPKGIFSIYLPMEVWFTWSLWSISIIFCFAFSQPSTPPWHYSKNRSSQGQRRINNLLDHEKILWKSNFFWVFWLIPLIPIFSNKLSAQIEFPKISLHPILICFFHCLILTVNSL